MTAIRVLVADDEDLVRRSLQRLFERDKRFEWVGEAADGKEAVEKVIAQTPDVILLDLAMGGNDGLDAIKEIRAAAPDTKIVVLSSMVRYAETGEKALGLGAHKVLDKFTPPRQLAKAILEVTKEKI